MAGRLGAAEASALIADIERAVLWNGRKTGKTWFHPRACTLPNPNVSDHPTVLMTLQDITGSDFYGPVHWTTSTDLGKTWREPELIPAFTRRDLADGLQEGVCDVVPQFHPPTGVVLAMGHNVYYRNNKLTKPGEDRFPVYAVRAPDGRWSERRTLAWDDPRGSAIYTCGCGERLVLADGDMLVPISFGPKGRTHRSVTTLRCGFDGRELKVKQAGNELVNAAKRGLLEPSLATHRGGYFMTIRAEDDRGYVTRSADGLKWAEPQPWRFDDGEPLVMSTTQQHWLPHGERLHLVYTRKTAQNEKVMRWRAPVFIAAVDAVSLRLVRATETVLFPLSGDPASAPTSIPRMGNFHPVTVNARESWVTVGEENPAAAWQGDTLLARVRWARPNEAL